LYLTEAWDITWNPREMGSTQLGGMKEGPAPQVESKIKKLTTSRGGDNSLMEQEDGKKGEV
jgi:hypothetical protein